MKTLTSRERVMAIVVLIALFVTGNYIVLSSLFQRYSDLTHGLTTKQLQLRSINQMFSQRELWAKRNDWLTQKQPKLTNRDEAGVNLLNEVKAAAKLHDVALDNLGLSPAIDVEPRYQSVSVQVETHSSWGNLITFLHAIQQPDHFIVFESFSLEIDPADATKMHGKLSIAKWYAP